MSAGESCSHIIITQLQLFRARFLYVGSISQQSRCEGTRDGRRLLTHTRRVWQTDRQTDTQTDTHTHALTHAHTHTHTQVDSQAETALLSSRTSELHQPHSHLRTKTIVAVSEAFVAISWPTPKGKHSSAPGSLRRGPHFQGPQCPSAGHAEWGSSHQSLSFIMAFIITTCHLSFLEALQLDCCIMLSDLSCLTKRGSYFIRDDIN